MVSETAPRQIRCIGCGAMVPDIEGPTHAYMESSPGCWRVYGELLARQYSDPAFRDVQRMTADAYAVQHPGRPSPVAIQSVCGHLVSLYWVLERGAAYSYANRVLEVALKEKETRFVWLSPPASMGKIAVVEVVATEALEEHEQMVGSWARSAWTAWSEHHETIRQWAISFQP